MEPIPLQFQLLYNWEVEATEEAILKHKTRMYPIFKVELNETPIYRLIHHEFERHYISAGQLFKANGLTITEGFFLFELKLTDFEVDFLITQFPYCDVWVSVEQARTMALALGVEYELGLLLGEQLDGCFSSDNLSRNEIMHNWTIPTIPNLQYSTRALLEATFDSVEISNRKIRTQIARSKQTGMVMKDRTETGLVRWQVWAYEQFLQQQNSTNEMPVLDRSGAVWDSLQGIFFDLQTLGRGGQLTGTRVLSDNMMVGNMPLKKEYLGHSLLLQQLYIAVMSEKIMNELNRIPKEQQPTPPPPQQQQLREVSQQSASSSSILSNTPREDIMFHDRMDLLEQELYRVKRRAKKKFEEIELYHDELTQQINELRNFKLQSERARKSERVWMLMFMICVIISLRTFYS